MTDIFERLFDIIDGAERRGAKIHSLNVTQKEFDEIVKRSSMTPTFEQSCFNPKTSKNAQAKFLGVPLKIVKTL